MCFHYYYFFLSIHIHIIQKNLKIYSYVLTFRFIRMEIVNKDFKIFYVSGFNYALKNVSYFFRVSFRDLQEPRTIPGRIKIRKELFIEFESSDSNVFSNEIIKKAEENLLEALCIGILERLFSNEEKPWAKLRYLESEIRRFGNLEDEIEIMIGRKRKKLKKLFTNKKPKQLVDERFFRIFEFIYLFLLQFFFGYFKFS